jgi:hypothetical protein
VTRNFEIFNEVSDAIRLLRDPQLVWSPDLQSIRKPLVQLLEYATTDVHMARLIAPLATAITQSEAEF